MGCYSGVVDQNLISMDFTIIFILSEVFTMHNHFFFVKYITL